MLKGTVITVLLVFAVMTSAVASDTVTFKSKTKTLTGKLTKPPGDGPFPAVVLLHGCRGITADYDERVERLANWGYVALIVNSFGPRGMSSDCAKPIKLSLQKRVQDAYAGKAHLAGLTFVDGNRVAVMGWSYGGVTTLSAVSTSRGTGKRDDLFRAGVAFYPSCRKAGASLNAPLLILIGELDDWTPVSRCQRLTKRWLKRGTGHELVLKVYPGAYHGFDAKGVDRKIMGHRVKYDPAAAAEAITRVKEFLAKHLQ